MRKLSWFNIEMEGNLKIRQKVIFLLVAYLLDFSYISPKYYQIRAFLWETEGQMDWQTDGRTF